MSAIIIWLLVPWVCLTEEQRELWWVVYYSLVCEVLGSCSEWGWICGLWIREARLEIPLGENNWIDPVDWRHSGTTVCGKEVIVTNWELQDESRRLNYKWCDVCLPGVSVAGVVLAQASVTAASWWGGLEVWMQKSGATFAARLGCLSNTIGRRYYFIWWWDVGLQYSPKVRESTWKISQGYFGLFWRCATNRWSQHHRGCDCHPVMLHVIFLLECCSFLSWNWLHVIGRSWGKVECWRSCDGDGI